MPPADHARVATTHEPPHALRRTLPLADPARSDDGMLDEVLGTLEGIVVYRMEERADGETRFRYVSPAIRDVLGITRDDVLRDASCWFERIHPDDLSADIAARERARTTFETMTRDVRMQVGERVRIFSQRCKPHREGDVIVWDGMVRDVTAQRRAQRRNDRLAAITDATSDLVVTSWADGTVRHMNAAARAFFRMEDGIPEGTDVRDFRPARLADFYRDEVAPLMRETGLWEGESVIIDRDGRERPVSQVMIRHSRPDGTAERYSTILRDISGHAAEREALSEANEHASIMLREVNHRVKNLFALVPAIVQLSARGKSNVNEVVATVRDRVGALARSHTLTLNAFSQAQGVELRAMVDAVLEPFHDDDPFSIDGPSVRLSSRDANAVALVLHELATNAAKHGALSVRDAHVAIDWSTDAQAKTLILAWRESGGPPVTPPAADAVGGFGTELLDRLVGAQGGSITRDWAREGLAIEMHLPIT